MLKMPMYLQDLIVNEYKEAKKNKIKIDTYYIMTKYKKELKRGGVALKNLDRYCKVLKGRVKREAIKLKKLSHIDTSDKVAELERLNKAIREQERRIEEQKRQIAENNKILAQPEAQLENEKREFENEKEQFKNKKREFENEEKERKDKLRRIEDKTANQERRLKGYTEALYFQKSLDWVYDQIDFKIEKKPNGEPNVELTLKEGVRLNAKEGFFFTLINRAIAENIRGKKSDFSTLLGKMLQAPEKAILLFQQNNTMSQSVEISNSVSNKAYTDALQTLKVPQNDITIAGDAQSVNEDIV